MLGVEGGEGEEEEEEEEREGETERAVEGEEEGEEEGEALYLSIDSDGSEYYIVSIPYPAGATTFTQCSAGGYGGALFFNIESSQVPSSFDGLSFSGNSATKGAKKHLY